MRAIGSLCSIRHGPSTRTDRPVLWKKIQGRANPSTSLWMSVQTYLQTHIDETRWVNINGDTFLHWILYSYRPPLAVVKAVIDAYPEALEILNRFSRLPLHYASTATAGHCSGVFQAVFDGCPQAAFFRSCDDRLPFNYALNWDETSVRKDSEDVVLPSFAWAILSRSNVKCICMLLDANPQSVLCSGFISDDPWEIVCKLWQHPMIENRSLRRNLRLITLSVLKAKAIAIHGEDSKFRPLHAMLEQDNAPLSIDSLRAYFLFLLSRKDADDALYINQNNRLCLSMAIEQGQIWCDEDDKGVIKRLCEASANEAVKTRDINTRMFPFMAAAEGENADLGTVFELLKCSPTSARALYQNSSLLALHEEIVKLKVKNQGLLVEINELKTEVSDLKCYNQTGAMQILNKNLPRK